MPTRDEKGFIRYSHEELERVPPFELRSRGPNMNMAAGVGGGTLATLAGATIGSAFGPAGTLIGGAAGALIGGAAGAGAATMNRPRP